MDPSDFVYEEPLGVAQHDSPPTQQNLSMSQPVSDTPKTFPKHPPRATPLTPQSAPSSTDPPWLETLKALYQQGELDPPAREYLEKMSAAHAPRTEKIAKYEQVARHYKLLPST